MHPQSPALTILGTVLKESDNLVILGVTFDSKLTFEKNLLSVSRAASQRPDGVLRKSWQVFHDRLLLGRYYSGFVLPVLEYCSAVLCSAANTHLKLLHCEVSGASFSTGVCLSVTAYLRSEAVLCMLYNIRCNTLYPLYGALPVTHVPVRVTRGIAHRYTYAPPRCRTSQYSRTFVRFSASLWNDLSDPVFDGVGLSGFKSKVNVSLLA